MSKKELEHKVLSLEVENSQLRWVIQEIWWMARRYAHGRQTYAASTFNEAIETAQKLGMNFEPDPVDGIITAKDGMIDKDWFKARENNSVKFITGEDP